MLDFSEALIILAKTGDIKISFKNPQYLIENYDDSLEYSVLWKHGLKLNIMEVLYDRLGNI